MRVIEQLESDVRSYVRTFPAIFDTAEGAILKDEQGNEYIDFFAGAGTLNYGHNHPKVPQAVIKYLQRNGYHGLTMGSLAVTGNYFYRDESYGARANVDHLPFDGFFGPEVNTIHYLRKYLEDGGSGVDLPAAVIVETVQGEGGINVASKTWLQELELLCREFDILLIVDDIQVGNGRTGQFFSFEEAGITPDIVCLSKAIGGGLPMALVLMRPELDQWQPGEHTGTFRGNNLAFVAATELLSYWENDDLSDSVQYKSAIIQESLNKIVDNQPDLNIEVRGRGMVWGLDMPRSGFVTELSKRAFESKLLAETCGSDGQVLKLLPPLIIEEELLRRGLEILDQSVDNLWQEKQAALSGDVL